MGLISILLIVVACVVAFTGFQSLSEATLGVGLICAACFLGIVARFAQAAGYQQELREYLLKEAPWNAKHEA